MKLRRRWKVFWNLMAVFAIIVVVRRWDPPFDDSALAIAPIHVPPEQDAFPLYAAIAKDVAQRLPRGAELSLRQYLKDKENGWLNVANVVNNNEWVLVRLGEADRLPRFGWPAAREDHPRTRRPHSEMLALSRFCLLAGSLALHEGKTDIAATYCTLNLRLARHMLESADDHMTWLSASSVLSVSLTQAKDVAAKGDCTESRLSEMVGHLQILRNASPAQRVLAARFYQAEKFELAQMERRDELTRTWKMVDGGLCLAPPGKANAIIERVMRGIGYLPNRSRRILYEHNIKLAGISPPYAGPSSAWTAFASHVVHRHGTFKARSPLRYLRPNFIGEACTQSFSTGHFAAEFVKYSQALDLHRVFLALHLYRKTHGAFPQQLSDLVPTHLDAVPKDGYDGGNLKFDRERGIVYSRWPVDADQGERPVSVYQLMDHPPNDTPQRDNLLTVLFLEGQPEP